MTSTQPVADFFAPVGTRYYASTGDTRFTIRTRKSMRNGQESTHVILIVEAWNTNTDKFEVTNWNADDNDFRIAELLTDGKWYRADRDPIDVRQFIGREDIFGRVIDFKM